MADKQTEDAGPELDADGIPIQTYISTVLVVVPSKDFGEQALRYARSCLHNVHVGTRSVSTEYDGMVVGRLQDEFLVDQQIAGVSLDGYSGVIFAGGKGALEMAENADAQRLAREASTSNKLIGAWGEALAVLTRAGVVKGKKVTGAKQLADDVKRAGGKYQTAQLVTSGRMVTALDESAGMRFGKALASVVEI
jgi:putative intracellular protease/amidase